jgi:hypothetical protein
MKIFAGLFCAAAALLGAGNAFAAEPFVLATLDFVYASDGSLLHPMFRKNAAGWEAIRCDASLCENFEHPEQEQRCTCGRKAARSDRW